MDIKVTTAAGGTFIIKEASAFGPDGIMGHTQSDPTLRVWRISETDTVEAINR